MVPFLFSACWKSGETQPVSNANLPVTNGSQGNVSNNAMKLISPAFQDGGPIPKKYTCQGENVSPPFSFAGVPASAKSLALICDDPDAPGKTWTHWVLFNLPASTREIPEGLPRQETIANGAKQGITDFKTAGYGGPCPPSGTHRYFFKIYALDTEVKVAGGASKEQLLKAIEGHVIDEGQLIGTYQKQ
jgi:Raf kinase inhibitor-like YbhB/YbcL family protein